MKKTTGRTIRCYGPAALAVVGMLLPCAALAATAPDAGAAAPVQAPADADPFRFTSDAGLIMWQVKPVAAADFELVWRVIRQRVASSTHEGAKALLASMTIYAPGISTPDSVTYVFRIDPVIPAASYSPTFLLFETKLFERAEADELFATMSGALVAGNAVSTMPLKYIR